MKKTTNKDSKLTKNAGKKRPVKQPVISAPATCSDSVEEYNTDLPAINNINKDSSRLTKDIPIEAILGYRDKNLSKADMARLLGCSPANITQRLRGYESKIVAVDNHKRYRADALTDITRRLLQSITPDEIKKLNMRDKVMCYGILYDKERLERGQSTGNIAIKDVASHYSNEISKLSKQRQEIMQQLGISSDTDTSADGSQLSD